MLVLHHCFAPPLLPETILSCHSSRQVNYSFPCLTVTLPKRNYRRTKRDFVSSASKKSAKNAQVKNEEDEVQDIDFNQDFDGFRSDLSSSSKFRGSDEQKDYDRDPELAEIIGSSLLDPQKARSKDFDGFRSDFSSSSELRGSNEQKDYDRDPELAEIMSSSLLDPQKARSKVEERFRSKRNKMVQTKMGSAKPMNVTFNKFDFSNSFIWFELYNIPLEKDISLLCDTIRAWFIVGRLGGCNSMNMQLSQSNFDKRPQYDAIQGANVTPSTFYNIGDLEIQENLARIWVDIGTSEPLLLDVLINALTQISSDFVGIKQLVFGGSEFENWKENLKSEDAGCSVHNI